jgi:hypothetical protein
MNRLRYSRDLREVVEIRDTLTADEALDVLCRALLGETYYIADPVGGEQANAIIVRDILSKYAPRKERQYR